MIERRVALLGILIEQHGVALREGAAFAILAGQPHRVAFLEQRAEGQGFAGRPVDAFAGFDRLGAVVEETLNRLVHGKAVRRRCYFLADIAQRLERDAGVAAARIVDLARGLHA